MVAQLRALFLVVIATAVAVSAASINKINRRPVDANQYFLDNSEPKEAHYIYFGGDDVHGPTSAGQFCSEWHKGALKYQREGGASVVSENCKVVSHKRSVAAVWATEAQNHGKTFSRTGQVGYDLVGTTFVTPKKEPYYEQGGTCDKVVRGWCRDKFVPHIGVEL